MKNSVLRSNREDERSWEGVIVNEMVREKEAYGKEGMRIERNWTKKAMKNVIWRYIRENSKQNKIRQNYRIFIF